MNVPLKLKLDVASMVGKMRKKFRIFWSCKPKPRRLIREEIRKEDNVIIYIVTCFPPHNQMQPII